MHNHFRVCSIENHDQCFIEYVCTFSDCQSSRFLCSKCLNLENHKHQLHDNSHMLNFLRLKDFIKNKIKQRLIEYPKGIKQLTNELKQKISEIQIKLNNIINMIDIIQQDLSQYNELEFSYQQFSELQLDCFNYVNDNQINILLDVDKYIKQQYQLVSEQFNNMIQNIIRIQEYCHFNQKENEQTYKRIRDAKYKTETLQQVSDNKFISLAISNNFRYILSAGPEKKLYLWNKNCKLIKTINLKGSIYFIQFTDNSQSIFIASQNKIYQFFNDQFKVIFKLKHFEKNINNIICINSCRILISLVDGTIILIDTFRKKQLLFIKAHNERMNGLDYNQKLNIIASSSYDKSIKLWNCFNGQLILEQQNAYNKECKFIFKVLFIIEQNQLVSLDSTGNVIIWNIHFQTKSLEQFILINDVNLIYNISLVLNQQFILLVCRDYIKIFTIKGEYVRSFEHRVKEFCIYKIISDLSNITQHQSMEAIYIKGKKMLQVCKVYI